MEPLYGSKLSCVASSPSHPLSLTVCQQEDLGVTMDAGLAPEEVRPDPVCRMEEPHMASRTVEPEVVQPDHVCRMEQPHLAGRTVEPHFADYTDVPDYYVRDV